MYFGRFCVFGNSEETHISNICTKAKKKRRTLFSCPQNVMEAAYKSMVRPIFEYGSSVWDPHPDKLQEELEKVQNRAARFIMKLCLWKWEYDWHSWTIEMGIP